MKLKDTVYISGGQIWTSANDGASSGLDADTLDGNQATAFAAASHTHDDRYFTETESDSRFLKLAGGTLTGQLNLHAGSYEGSIVFGSASTWRTGIRQHDDADAELRIWAKNANGMIFLATGYDGEPADIARPTDGLAIQGNKLGIGNFSTADPEYKLHVKGDIYANGGWVRVSGNDGLYFETHGGGWRMTDSTWIRAYNDKNIYTGGKLEVGGSVRGDSGFMDDHKRFVNVGGGYSVNNASGTGGAIKIELPTAVNNSNTMMSMTVHVYEYSTGQSFTIRCGGYNYGNGNWYNEFAYMLNDSGKGGDVPVYFGNDGTRNIIWIGNSDWSWSYPNVFVTDFQAGHSQSENWKTGWRVSFDTAARTNVTASRTAFRLISWGNYSLLDARYYTESEVDTLLGTKAASSHTHDDRYYTETEVDTLLAGKQAAGTYLTSLPSHNHDDRYFTETESDSRFLKLAGGTMTGTLTAPTIVPTLFHYAYGWRKYFKVRSVGVTGGSINSKWVHLFSVEIVGSYDKALIKAKLNGYDDVSIGTEVIHALYENGGSTQENHDLYWYSIDNTASIFKAVKSIRTSASGLRNTYEVWAQMAGDWRDTFTMEVEFWEEENRALTFGTAAGQVEEPSGDDNDIVKTSRQWAVNSNLYIGGNITLAGTVDGRDIATDGTKLDGIAANANNYSLPAASATVLGGIKVGTNLSIDANGVLSSTDTNTDTTYAAGKGLSLSSGTFNAQVEYINDAYLNESGDTASFLAELARDYGCFSGTAKTLKLAWSYAGNSNLDTVTHGTIELAGCVIETWGSTYKHVRITRPNTGTGASADMLVYNDQSSGYSPGWTRIYNSRNLTLATLGYTGATDANNYSLPVASASTLGGIKVGTNLSISDGVLSSTDTNTWRPLGTGATDAAAGNHTHNIILTQGNYVWDASTRAGDYTTGIQTSFVRSANGWPDYGAVLHVGARGGGDAGGDFQLYMGHGSIYGGTSLRVRSADNDAAVSDSWTEWKTILDSSNVGDYALTALPSHTHDDRYYTESEVDTLLAGKLGSTAKAADSELIDGIDSTAIVYGGAGRASSRVSSMNDTNQKSGFYYEYQPTGNPFGEWWNWMTVAGNSWQSSNNYSFQLAHNFHGDDFYVRRMTNGTAYDWRKIVDSSNIGSYAAAVSHTHDDRYYTESEVDTLLGTKAASSHTHGIGSITDASRWWNNFGNNHGTTRSFDATGGTLTTGFGWRYVQGNVNGPGTDSSPYQFYALTVGLGNEYNYDSYGMQLAIPRNTATPYISVRFEENRVLGGWQKISAGYADSAGSVAWSNVSGKPTTFSPSSHTHDDRYYTESEVNSLLNAKGDAIPVSQDGEALGNLASIVVLQEEQRAEFTTTSGNKFSVMLAG